MSQSGRRRTRGQSMVEFALIGPLFFILIFGVMEMGRLLWINHELANGTREGARLAAVRGSESTAPITAAGPIRLHIIDSTTGLNGTRLTVSGVGLGGEPGTTVTITASYQYNVMLGIIPGLSDFTLTQSSSSIIQH